MFEGLLRPMHLLVILIIAMLVFPKRLPELGKSLAETIRGFKKGMDGEPPKPTEIAERGKDTPKT
jgi:sec-independent protein translocase protein TatA